MSDVKNLLDGAEIHATKDYDYGTLLRDPCEIAELMGMRCVLPRANEIQIDLDTKVSVLAKEEFMERLNEYERVIGDTFAHPKPEGFQSPVVRDLSITPSKTRGNYHATVRFDRDLLAVERILLQYMLASDPMREYLNGLAYFAGAHERSAMFELRDDPAEAMAELTRLGQEMQPEMYKPPACPTCKMDEEVDDDQ